MKIIYKDGTVAECPQEEELHVLRHTAAHIMAQAIKRLYPQADFAFGPATENGFYYDVDLGDIKLTDEDLAAIEKEMKKICKEGKKIYRREVSKAEAMEMFKDDMYKLDLISNLEDGNITVYDQGDFTDLCRGPHVDNTKLCKNFKLVKHSGVYWKGDANNHVMQRIYGVCFPTAEELEAHLKELEEAKERDHRKIGKEMELFMTDDLVGRGLPMFLPKGYTVWQELENYIKDKERRLGYLHVMTPCVGTVNLYKTSGHWDHYKENMFPPMEMEGESFVLRPMNCPHHMMIYANTQHSYKDLPLRMGELGIVHRHELSGALHGLMRVRCFTQDDAHIFMTREQIKDEIKGVVQLIDSVYSTFGFKYHIELSTQPEDSMGAKEDWDIATQALRDAITELGYDFEVNEGDGAFYGPKLDFHLTDCLGRTWQCGTIQLDFQLPERFELEYVGADGEKHRPIMIHRVVFGSIERFIGILTEHFAGAFPTWLAPVQVKLLPIADRHIDYLNTVKAKLEAAGIRCEVDDRSEKIGFKIRSAQMEKVPYMLVAGDKDIEAGTVSVRSRKDGDEGASTLEDFIARITEEIATKAK